MKRRPFIHREQSAASARVIALSGSAVIPEAGEDKDSDFNLLEQIVEGDQEAFAILVRRHTTRFYRIAYRVLRNQGDAEDIVQTAFLKLWERPTLWHADRNTAFTTWFYRIVVNLCLDYLKKKRPLQLVDDTGIEDEREAQEEIMLENEKQRLLETQLAALPERQRTALNLCFYEGLSNQEAANAMGLHLKALQALLMRAKVTLKERLKFYAGS